MKKTTKVRKKGQYDNLVTILTVASVLALTSFAANVADRYATKGVSAFYASKKIVGYVRPQAANPVEQDDLHAAFRNTTMPKTGDLKVTMSVENAKLLKQRFDQAVALLHAKQYDYAVMALNQVIELQPKMPEAYVNIGYAYLGLEQWDTAISAFTKASNLKPDQANAYYGLALALEGKKDYETALGAMRSYIHLSTPEDPFLAKARSALWEWEQILGRIPTPGQSPKAEEQPTIATEGSLHETE